MAVTAADVAAQVGGYVGWPVYLEHKGDHEWHLDKYKGPGGGQRTRYLLTPTDGRVRCSCLGWMKYGDCKHLRALRADWAWVKDGGVVPEYVQAYLPELVLGLDLEGGISMARAACEALDQSEPLDYIGSVTLPLLPDSPVGLETAWAVHRFPDGRGLAVVLAAENVEFSSP